jgi:hypothetical protein
MKKVVAVALVLGLALLGGGIWAFLHPEVKHSATVSIAGTQINLPAGTEVSKNAPVIVMGVTHQNSTTREYLYLYDNRLVIFLQEAGVRPDLGREGSRIWKTGVLSQNEFNDLMSLITSKTDELKEAYQFPGFSGPDGNNHTGDMNSLISINYQGIQKTVKAANFLSAYSDYTTGTYAGMPSPLAEICQKLNEIGTKAVEFYHQTIT